MDGQMDQALSNAVDNFERCIKIQLDPVVPSETRQNALSFCDNFRNNESSSTMAAVGLILTTKTEPEIVLAGLKLIEDITKYHWDRFERPDVVKNRLLYLLEHEFDHLPTQPSYIKEALAKTIVEIAKREWPQLWPDLIPSLLALGNKSLLAYVVLRRLFEDVALIQKEDGFIPRKRDLLQSMVAVSTNLLPTLFQLLTNSLEECTAQQTPLTVAKCSMFFGTILPFLEMVNVNLILSNNHVKLLFQLTRHPIFRIDAVECLVQLTQRKLDKREKLQIYAEFMENVNFICFLESLKNEGSEQGHFVKQLSDVVGFIGSCCGKDHDSVGKFLTVCELLASKPETAGPVGSAIAFHNFLRTAVDSDKDCLKADDLSEMQKNILNLLLKKLVSADREAEEKDELARLKTEFCGILRLMSKVWPKVYLFLYPWINSALSNPQNMTAFHWESLGSVVDTVTLTISQEEEDVIQLGLQHLEKVFMIYSAEENLILKSAILSTVSGLFIFLSLAKKRTLFTSQITNLMCSIIKSLFHCFSYNPDVSRVLRRHVASLFIKLAKENGELFVEMFDSIHQETIILKPNLVSMEYVNLIESLLITSNNWQNRNRQLNFITSLIVASDWKEIASLCHSVPEFTTMFTEDLFYTKRSLLLKNMSVIVALFNRVQFPGESHAEQDFIESLFNLLRPAIPVVLELTRTLHNLLLDPVTAPLLDMSPGERNAFLGYAENCGNDNTINQIKPFKEKLKNFLRSLEDAAYGILGGCGPTFGYRLYAIPHIAEAYLAYVGDTCLEMSDFQIRRFLKMVYKPFLLSCPLDHVKTVLIPFMQEFGPFLMQRLVNRWRTVNYYSMEDENAPSEEAQIIEDAVLHALTKDYLDLVHKLLTMSTATREDLNRTIYVPGGMDLDDDSIQNYGKGNQSSSSNEVGDIGKQLLDEATCFQSIVHLSAVALNWKFSQVCFKAAKNLLLSMKFIANFPDVLLGVFNAALEAVISAKEVDPSFDSIFRIIDTIISDYSEYNPSILESFRNWGASSADISRLLNLFKGNHNVNVKKRKEIIRNLVRNNTTTPDIPKATWLADLPRIVIYDPEKKQDLKEVDLRECFSLIHLS